MADQGTAAMEREQSFLFASQVAPFLRGKKERLLPLHRVGALIGHVERIARQVAIGCLETRVERLAVVAQLLDHPRALFEEPLLKMAQLLFVEPLALGLRGFRRHYLAPPFRPS